MATTSAPTIHRNPAAPDWGRGVVLQTRDNKAIMRFEHGGHKVLALAFVKRLEKVELPDTEAVALETYLRGQRPPPTAQPTIGGKKVKPKTPKAPATGPYMSFDAQVEWFQKHYPGGFQGDRFIVQQRGAPDATAKKGFKEAAIKRAAAELTPEAFEKGDAAAIFATLKAIVVGNTDIVLPLSDGIPFQRMEEADQKAVVDALGALLHGDAGSEAERFDAFVAAFKLKDGKGVAKKVTWPLVTLFPSAYRPTEHVAVKPTYFRWQARLVGLTVADTTLPDAKTYAQYLAVAKETESRLKAKGLDPRDLLDVYSFVTATQSDKPAAPKKAAPPPPPPAAS